MKPTTCASAVTIAIGLFSLTGCTEVEPSQDALRAEAEAGDAEAQFNLAVMYRSGEGVAQDHLEAVRWYRLAAEQGNADAQFGLGRSYQRGDGVSEDEQEAAKWFLVAAEQGNADAQFNLGAMFANGSGAPQGNVQAHMWLNLAASQMTGDERERAVDARDTVAARMTPAALDEAQRLAREWDAVHP